MVSFLLSSVYRLFNPFAVRQKLTALNFFGRSWFDSAHHDITFWSAYKDKCHAERSRSTTKQNAICNWPSGQRLFTYGRVLLFLLLACFQFSYAQNQYWSQQYGGEATLLGGTGVVGVNDNSCIFYNPAAAHLVDTFNITASTYVAGMEYKNLKNGAGNGVDLQDINLYILPQVLSVSIPIKKVPRLKLILGTLLRYNTSINFSQESQNTNNVIAGSPGPQYYQGQVQYGNNSAEQWTGISAAYKISQIFSVGVTAFTTYTHMQVNDAEDLTVDAMSNGIPYSAAVNVNNSMTLNQFNEVFKLGAIARFSNVHLGASVTMPGIRMYGLGTVSKSFEVYNLNQNASDTLIAAQKHPSYIVSDAQTSLGTYYRQPLSASLGFELLYPKFRITASLEFFAGQKNLMIMQGANNAYLRPTAAYGYDTISGFMTLQTGTIPVLNAGVGAEIKVKPTVNLLAGIRTDFNNHAEYLPNDLPLGVAGIISPEWSYLYFSGGVSYKLNRHEVILGYDYGVGIANTRQQIFNITEPTQNLFLNGATNNSMRTHINKLNVILSWTYFFKASTKNSSAISIYDFIPPPPPPKHKKLFHKKVTPMNTQGQPVKITN